MPQPPNSRPILPENNCQQDKTSQNERKFLYLTGIVELAA